MCIPEPPSQIFFGDIFFPRYLQTSQVILMEDLGNYCDRESIFVDLIFIYKFLEPSFVPATQGWWWNSISWFLTSGFGQRGKDYSNSNVQKVSEQAKPEKDMSVFNMWIIIELLINNSCKYNILVLTSRFLITFWVIVFLQHLIQDRSLNICCVTEKKEDSL